MIFKFVYVQINRTSYTRYVHQHLPWPFRMSASAGEPVKAVEKVKTRSKKHGSSSYIAFINGIPRFSSSRQVRRAISSALRGYAFKQLVIDHNSDGHARGYAWIYFQSASDRDRCCDEMSCIDITVPISGTPSSVAPDAEEISLPPVRVISLTIQPCLNNKLCLAWPFVSHEQRQLLKLDPEAYYSITDGYAAMDTTDIIRIFLTTLAGYRSGTGVAVDCTAGAGGNATALINPCLFQTVIAVEVNPSRHADLESNLSAVCGTSEKYNYSPVPWKAINADILQALFYPADDQQTVFTSTAQYDVLYFDPPWGGQHYRQNMGLSSDAHASVSTLLSDYELQTEACVTDALNAEIFADYGSRKVTGDGGEVTTYVTLSRLLGYECTIGSLANAVKLAVMKVPSEFDATAFCRRIVGQSHWGTDISADGVAVECRPHPFRFQMGARTALIVIAYPSYFRNFALNDVMPALAAFDLSRGEEYHPRFFDWEKEVWISCRRWRGF